MSDDLRQIVADLRAGKGTLGALLVDPSVYEDLKMVLGNVERNKALRALVRYSIRRDEASGATVRDESSAAVGRQRVQDQHAGGKSRRRSGCPASSAPTVLEPTTSILRPWCCASSSGWADSPSCSASSALASYFAVHFGTGGLWRGLAAAHAVASPGNPQPPYDLTQLVAVNETLNTIRAKYVDPSRVKPRQMFLSALNQIQSEVAQVIVRYDEKTLEGAGPGRHRVERVPRRQRAGPLGRGGAPARGVRVSCSSNLKDTDVDLREVEYAACNGMLRTLDPHSVFLSPDAYREMNLSTSGHFGGLGIVISIRDQLLTIMRPMPGTPAGRAGLKRLDRITKINNESTLNMPLDDAVQRLRGKPGSKVTVWVAARRRRRAGRARARSSSCARRSRSSRSRSRALAAGHRLRADQAVPGEHRRRARRGARASCTRRSA